MNDTPIRMWLTQLIDYAGLFPPAQLGMEQSLANCSKYLQDDHAWMLGRFIAPVARLAEFERAAASILPIRGSIALRLSVLSGPELDADIIRDFNLRNAGAVQIDAVEIKAAKREEILQAIGRVPDGMDIFFEIPADADLQTLKSIKSAGAHAKVRTGGVLPELFPPAEMLAGFIRACSAEGVSFKATAGLHHALRGNYRLTYDQDSEAAVMHGFLNVLLTAVFATKGMPLPELAELLQEQSKEAFAFDSSGARWRNHHAAAEELAAARRNLFVSFGSCSFHEPIADLHALNLI